MGKRYTNDILKFLIGFSLLIILNQLAGLYFYRIDLTSEKRFTIKPATKEILENLDDKVYIDVYLAGELNSAFKRFQKSIRETLEEFEIYSGGNIVFDFVDPTLAKSQEARNKFMADLASRGIQPTNIIDNRDGNRVEKLIFPGALVNYMGVEKPVMLLQGTQGQEQLNNSLENIEYNLISAIYQLTALERKKVGFIQGHGELDSVEIISFQNTLYEFFDIKEIELKNSESLKDFEVVVIAKPTRKWSERDKYILDQYIMKGGKALFLMDRNDADLEKANTEDNYSFPVESGLEDMLFKYGIRLNQDLVQDNNAAVYPIIIGNYGQGQPQIAPIPWPYFPVLNNFGNHMIVKNLDATLGRFIGTIDTVKAEGILKTPLIMTSQYSRSISTPAQVTIADLRQNLDPASLNQSFIPIAYLLEGPFTSVFKNRFLPEGLENSGFIEQGEDTKIIAIADGDFIKNDIDMETGEPLPLGRFNFQQGAYYGNEDFLLNAVAFLVEENGIITARNKEISIRPLDMVRINAEKSFWQFINLGLPLVLIIFIGLALNQLRKFRYAKKGKSE